jgi:hypothetical protein
LGGGGGRGFARGDKLLWDRRQAVEARYRHYFDLVIAADWYAAFLPTSPRPLPLARGDLHGAFPFLWN